MITKLWRKWCGSRKYNTALDIIAFGLWLVGASFWLQYHDVCKCVIKLACLSHPPFLTSFHALSSISWNVACELGCHFHYHIILSCAYGLPCMCTQWDAFTLLTQSPDPFHWPIVGTSLWLFKCSLDESEYIGSTLGIHVAFFLMLHF